MKLSDFGNIPFRMQDLSSVFPAVADLAGKVKRLEAQGVVIRLKRGLYVVSSIHSNVSLSEFVIANHIYGPSYVSMQSALRHYGLIPEAVYATTSVTTGLARRYVNKVGTFTYVHSSPEYYATGLTIAEDGGATCIMATPEKAICDLMVFTPNLNLRYRAEIITYLEEDLRFDTDALANFDPRLIAEIARHSKKKTVLNQLIKLIENEHHI